MKAQPFSFKETLVLMGSLIASYIGAGFATGQEVMQFCAAYGRPSFLFVACFFVLFTYALRSCAKAGAQKQLTHGKDVFYHFCGRRAGALYDLYATAFLYLSLIIMHGGAASTAHTQWGLPAWGGALLLAVLIGGTVVMGLDRLVDILGVLGPVTIAMIIFTTGVTVWLDADKIAAGMKMIETGEVNVPRIGSSFFTATLSNVGFVILFYAPFMTELGAKKDRRELKCATFSAVAAISAAMIIVSLALIATIRTSAAADIPTLLMARRISPVFAQAFSFVIYAGIYTASVPLLWTVSTRFAEGGTVRHRLVVVLLTLGAVVISVCLPYKTLVNTIYGFGGYLGAFLLLFMIAHTVRTTFSRKASS